LLNNWCRSILWVLIVLAVAASGVILAERVKIEESNRNITLAVDFQEVERLAEWSGFSIEETLTRVQQQGVNALLFKEMTVDDLWQKVWVGTASEALNLFPESIKREVRKGYTYFYTGDRELAESLELHLQNKIPGEVQVITADGYTAIGTPLSLKEIKDSKLGLGFNLKGMELARRNKMLIIPQVRWWYGANPASLTAIFNPLSGYRDSIVAVLFNDKDLPGYPDYIDNLAAQVRQLRVPVGIIEFFPQKGLDQLTILLDKEAVRVHSISAEEMVNTTFTQAVKRFGLAARERNIRVLIARFKFMPGSTNWLQDNLNYLDILYRKILANGFTPGKAIPFMSFPFSRLLVFIAGLGILSAGVLLMVRLRFNRPGFIIGIIGLMVWAGILGLQYQVLLARKVMALAAAVIFPTLALLNAWSPQKRCLSDAVLVLIRTTFISLSGALIIAAILSDNAFFLKINQFSGVKIAFIVPLVLFTAAVIIRQEKRPFTTLKEWLNAGISVKLAILAVIIAVAGLLYISRSGNEGVGLLPFEGQVRSYLEDVLLARPRTKEFLLGYPFLLLSLVLGYQHRLLPLWLLGMVSQISLVNTFCHLHIPLLISLLRTFNGLWLGLLFGLVLVLVICRSKQCFRGNGLCRQ